MAYTMTNIQSFVLLNKSKTPVYCIFVITNPHKVPIVDYVPKVIIPENCRLDNKIYTDSDFFDQ